MISFGPSALMGRINAHIKWLEAVSPSCSPLPCETTTRGTITEAEDTESAGVWILDFPVGRTM